MRKNNRHLLVKLYEKVPSLDKPNYLLDLPRLSKPPFVNAPWTYELRFRSNAVA
jgi:hypothetical protein